jgi:hypothetical protein
LFAEKLVNTLNESELLTKPKILILFFVNYEWHGKLLTLTIRHEINQSLHSLSLSYLEDLKKGAPEKVQIDCPPKGFEVCMAVEFKLIGSLTPQKRPKHIYQREHRNRLWFEDFFLPFGGKLSGDNC